MGKKKVNDEEKELEEIFTEETSNFNESNFDEPNFDESDFNEPNFESSNQAEPSEEVILEESIKVKENIESEVEDDEYMINPITGSRTFRLDEHGCRKNWHWDEELGRCIPN